jgi:hypothetical protein
MDKLVLGALKIYIALGHLAIVAAWGLTGILLYVVIPSFSVLWLLGFPNNAVGVVLVVLVVWLAQGFLQFKWKALQRAVDLFTNGIDVILESWQKSLRAIDELRTGREVELS